MNERVQKLIAQANIASRRAAEEMIRAGRVKVNGKTIGIGDKADPANDVITVDGERLKFSPTRRYIAYNKPINVLSAPASDRHDERPLVRDMIPVEGHLFTIGRLDAESEGLIVLTDDGELANRLMHPRYEHTKTYKVIVYGTPTQETLDRWEQGIFLEEGRTAPCSIRVQEREADATVLRIVMIEGKNRQIRRVAALLGHPVKKLMRTQVGQLQLGTLKRGEWRELTPEEIELMKTPASDLSYIRKLKRELRGKRFYTQPVETPELPRPSTFNPGASRPEKRPVQKSGRKPDSSGSREETPARGKRPTNRRPVSGRKPARSPRPAGSSRSSRSSRSDRGKRRDER